jgi:hypothetical protein
MCDLNTRPAVGRKEVGKFRKLGTKARQRIAPYQTLSLVNSKLLQCRKGREMADEEALPSEISPFGSLGDEVS